MLWGAVLSGLAVFLLVCGISFWFIGREKGSRLSEGRESATIYESIGHVFIPNDEKFLNQINFNTEKWKVACQINGEAYNPADVAARKMIGHIFFYIGIILALFFIRSLVAMAIAGLSGILLFAIFAELPFRLKLRKAEQIRIEIENELPRFMDLLEVGMGIELPIEMAIRVTAEQLDGRLSAEIVAANQRFEATNRESLLEILKELAEKYNVDALTELVMDITIGLEKGVNMQEIIARKNTEIKHAHLMGIKEVATKVSSRVLIPVVFFKIVPLLAFMMIPIIIQILQMK